MEYAVKILIADSSSLILLAKTGVLVRLVQMATVVLPVAVYEEVCGQAHVHAYSDARTVASLVEGERLLVRRVASLVDLPVALGVGEHEAISLFLQEKADAVLTDDGRAIRVCAFLGIPHVASPRVVVDLFLLRQMTRSEARTALNGLATYGRYSPDVIAAAFDELSAPGMEET